MSDTTENKLAALKKLSKSMDTLNKTYGARSVVRLGDAPLADVDVIPSGSIALDAAIGIGGFPKGRIVEIYGQESSGKTTLTLHAIAECQKSGGVAAFVDIEHAFDPYYASCIGVDIENLIFSQPDSGDEALEIVEGLIRSGDVDIIVIDSVAALIPKAEIEGEMGEAKMGLQARLMSQAMRKLSPVVGKTNTCCIFINQLREKIGVVFGNPKVTSGGNALKFYASVRLDVAKSGASLKTKEGDVVANHTKVKVIKNKLAPPFRVAEFDIVFGEGISRTSEVVDMGVTYDIIEKTGAWYKYKGAMIGQGREQTKAFMSDNPEVQEEITALIRERMSTNKEDWAETK